MPHQDESGELKPIVQPRLIRALKNRTRLVNLGLREEVLDNLEETVKERRRTDTVASRLSHEMMQSLSDTGKPVLEKSAKKRLDRVNEGILERL